MRRTASGAREAGLRRRGFEWLQPMWGQTFHTGSRLLMRATGATGSTLLLFGLSLLYGATMAPTISWAYGGADSGDLVTAALVGGVAHPGGYPTYLLLARLFLLLPFGEAAWRVNLLSLLCAALAASLLMLALTRVLGSSSWRSRVCAALGGLAFGLAPVPWSQALIAEVYALNALFCVALLYSTLPGPSGAAPLPTGSLTGTPGSRRFTWPGPPTGGLLGGLALGNHLTSGIFVLLRLAWLLWHAPRAGRASLLLRELFWHLAGLLVYLYIPFAAAGHPAINWGDAHDLAGFYWLVSGRLYHGYAFGLSWDELPGRLAALAAQVLAQFGIPGLLLAGLGLCYGPAHTRGLRWLSAVAGGLSALFGLLYNTADSWTYLIPLYLVAGLWIGLGSAWLLEWLGQLRQQALLRFAPHALALLLSLALLWPLPQRAAQLSLRQDRSALDYAEQVLQLAPAGALVLAEYDQAIFPLWYAHFGLQQRQDLLIVVPPLLDQPWYRRVLRTTYPQRALPETPTSDWLHSLAHTAPAVCLADPNTQPVLHCTEPGALPGW